LGDFTRYSLPLIFQLVVDSVDGDAAFYVVFVEAHASDEFEFIVGENSIDE
jgi:hypothetical protein